MQRGKMKAVILKNARLQGDYFEVVFTAPEIAEKATAGQFVHIRIDERNDNILRRPFSIHSTDPKAGTVSVAYKIVGKGTTAMSRLQSGYEFDVMGPLGIGFSAPQDDVVPVAVAGGYGSAALYLLSRVSKQKGVLLAGARSKDDVILTDRYTDAGFDVRIATDDGSLGSKGVVTSLIPQLLEDYKGRKLFFYGCGPHPMLMALGRMLKEKNLDGELSIDHKMCCGVGACFACVIKVNDPSSADKWRYARSCSEGPVFKLDDVYLGE